MLPIKPILNSKKSFLLIAGPCSAENKKQLFETAQLLTKTSQIDMFRCGIWKPRSSPDSFEGIGKKALPWLKEIETNYKIPVCIEIATAKHLELAIKAGIQHFWLGARTSVNPFSVQEIASASQGLENISIMIKNPVSPDLRLWYGNFERFAKAGIQKMAAIYRGFATGKIQLYRNDPAWKFLIEFKRVYKEIPVYCDPSHIAGKRKYLYEIAQKSLLLDVDGLMIEVHPTPNKALSDKEQQLSLSGLDKLLNKLIIPSKNDVNTDNNTLKKYREHLDIIDNELFHLLAKRFDIIKEIALYKKENKIAVLQIHRWDEVRNNILQTATQLNMDVSLVEMILSLLHETSIQYQEQIIRKLSSEPLT
ncbi:MAG: bifunctional 3-deoxy-7-phosphoheptulonate synthase/chorismate mutase type II [Bacteroidales bacterium]|jgi:chorismate mutase|nr:bifunctional 3-deoxy-7-phosphoheptulonate synthase/chorismate mutase type II [Bacteroidales bacterium]